MSDLKPCPFCGELPEKDFHDPMWSIHCVTCDYALQSRWPQCVDEMWNTRATPRHTEEVVEAAKRMICEARETISLRKTNLSGLADAADRLDSALSRAPAATKSGDGPCHWCSKPKAAHFYKNNQCYNDGGMTHCYLSSPPPPVTEQEEPKR